MTFQTSVRQFQTTGWPGEVSNEGPVRAQPWNIDSSVSGEVNTIGNVFSQLSDGQAQVGNPTADEQLFLGILGRPKEYALKGDGADTLAATYALADFENGELIDMGIIYIDLQTSGSVGDTLTYNVVTGLISSEAVTPVSGTALLVPNAKIIEQDIPSAGLAKIQLTN